MPVYHQATGFHTVDEFPKDDAGLMSVSLFGSSKKEVVTKKLDPEKTEGQ